MTDQPRRAPRKGGHRAGLVHTRADTAEVEDPTVTTGCRENIPVFVEAETLLSGIIQLGKDPADVEATDAELISTVMAWCEQCPISHGCYQRMSHFKYTGLAGGQLLYRGQPYSPRKAREDTDEGLTTP